MLEWEHRIAKMVARCAAEAEASVSRMAQQGVNIDLRLYFQPATQTQDGRLFLRPEGEAPEGCIIGSDNPFHGAIPYAAYKTWIRQRASRLPILASAH